MLSQQIVNVELAPNKIAIKYYTFQDGYGILIKEPSKIENGKYSYRLTKFKYPEVVDHINGFYNSSKDIQWESAVIEQQIEDYYLGSMLLQIEASIQSGKYVTDNFAYYANKVRTTKQTLYEEYKDFFPIGKILEGYHIKTSLFTNPQYEGHSSLDYLHPSYNQYLYPVNVLTVGFEFDIYPKVYTETPKIVNTKSIISVSNIQVQESFRTAGISDFDLKASDYVNKESDSVLIENDQQK